MKQKKIQHKNVNEFKTAETRFHKEINILLIPDRMNLADIYSTEDKDVGHYKGLRDQMVKHEED